MYKVLPVKEISQRDNVLVYEDNSCKVSYNLWAEKGNIGFTFLNKTEENIYLDLAESFFIINGNAYDYYKNRVFTSSKGSQQELSASGVATGINYLGFLQTKAITNKTGTSSNYSVAYNEEKIVCIPPLSSKKVSEYTIVQSIYRDCDLLRYPKNKNIIKKDFTESTTPYTFGNKIAYTLGQSEKIIRIENNFFVSEISNSPEKAVIIKKEETFCDEKSGDKTEYFTNSSPNEFYIHYIKDKTKWKH
jgi:hypothetical protein